ncbi:MAG: hypothetical protein AB8G99_08635 [Planctomycetaceae bacterium]
MDTDDIEEVDGTDPDIEVADLSTEQDLAVVDETSVPFYRNWVFWVSGLAAVPGCFLCIAIVRGMVSSGGEFNWMMWTTSGLTFFGSAGATVLPLLLALGFFLGGKEVEGPLVMEPERASAQSADEDDIEAVDDVFDEDDESDMDEFDDDDFEDDDDLDDFDDF